MVAGDASQILMLTAISDLNGGITSFDAAADDYMVKSFAVEELMTVQCALHRRPVALRSEQTVIGRLTYDFHHCDAKVGNKPLELLRREQLALEALYCRPGCTVLRATLKESVYAMDDEIGFNALDSHVLRLRRKLDDVAAGVETRVIRNFSYLLCAVV